MAEKTVSAILLCDFVSSPVGFLCIGKNDTCARIFIWIVAPDIKVAFGRILGCLARSLKPRVLIGSVVGYQLGNDTQFSPMRLNGKSAEIIQRAVRRMHIFITRYVITVVAQRRIVKRQHYLRGIEFFLVLSALNKLMVSNCALIELFHTPGVLITVQVYPEVIEVRSIKDQK
mgnify:CR=1 FL=1